jgi:hypothetical protein
MSSYDSLPEKFSNLMPILKNMNTVRHFAHIAALLTIAVEYNTIWSNASYNSPISNKILDVIKILSSINLDDIDSL